MSLMSPAVQDEPEAAPDQGADVNVDLRYNGKNMRWDGPTAYHQLNYRDRDQQNRHFDAAVALMPLDWSGRILDVGCGYGDFTSRIPVE
jgi:2-polyprenyl-3-methyl-5-hydroxy-6-metoxy-1,4-benzoquinol methylase